MTYIRANLDANHVTASARRRSPRNRTVTVNKRPYINFVTHAPDLAKWLREAQSDRKALEERGEQSTAAYRQLSRYVEQIQAIIQRSWPEGSNSKRRKTKAAQHSSAC
jgi:hypothetical protein